MAEEIQRVQAKEGADTVVDEHSPLVKLAVTMREHWHTLLQQRGADERAWAKLPKAELEEMHAEVARWVQTCEDVLAVYPSPEGKNNIAEDWRDSLIRKNTEIRALIDKKGEVT